jgi:1,2-phenylacetyl-CoA epoxidase PaaB subunit
MDSHESTPSKQMTMKAQRTYVRDQQVQSFVCRHSPIEAGDVQNLGEKKNTSQLPNTKKKYSTQFHSQFLLILNFVRSSEEGCKVSLFNFNGMHCLDACWEKPRNSASNYLLLS